MSLSPRVTAVLEALPLTPQTRVLELGCGPGALAREMVVRAGFVLAIDRSPAAIAATARAGAPPIDAGRLAVRVADAETFALEPGEAPFDLVVAVRVGALDGRHPAAGRRVMAALAAAAPGARLFVDGVEG